MSFLYTCIVVLSVALAVALLMGCSSPQARFKPTLDDPQFRLTVWNGEREGPAWGIDY